MRIDDLKAEERAEFEGELAEIVGAGEALERAAEMVKARGYSERAHKLRGLAQASCAQVYLLLQDWQERKGAA